MSMGWGWADILISQGYDYIYHYYPPKKSPPPPFSAVDIAQTGEGANIEYAQLVYYMLFVQIC